MPQRAGREGQEHPRVSAGTSRVSSTHTQRQLRTLSALLSSSLLVLINSSSNNVQDIAAVPPEAHSAGAAQGSFSLKIWQHRARIGVFTFLTGL